MSEPLRFSELQIGEHFIAFPVDGDDSGHGGYRKGGYLFLKIELVPNLPMAALSCVDYLKTYNSVRLADGTLDSFPPNLRVYLIHV